ncbi:MAG TPA: hypothetical protein DGR97_05150 [Gammaproteobacteria bacterium]|nr:hypothetical protein [Gammaproteobacteria bacterium]
MDSNITRTITVTPLAALVTLSLLLLMVTLIEFADGEIDRTKRIKLPDIYMPNVEREIRRIIEKPVKPEIDETPPPDIPKQEFEKIDDNAALNGMGLLGRIEINLDLDIGTGLQASDGEYLPIVKVAPQYPRRALTRGIEGYVIIQYTVTKQGTTRDGIVVEAQPEKIFDKAALKSASRYKYKPRVINGRAVEVPGVRTKITFEIDHE